MKYILILLFMTGCVSNYRVNSLERRMERQIVDLELRIKMNKLDDYLMHGKIDSSEAAELRSIYGKSAWMMKFEL